MRIWQLVCAPILNRLSYLHRLVEAFGPRAGIALYFKMGQIMRAKRGLYPLKLPGLPRPLLVRADTSDIDVFVQIFLHKEYDTENFPQHRIIEERYRQLLDHKITPLIIDCGANVGMTTVWFAHRYPEALIVAVEPDERNIAVLCRNCAEYSNVKIVEGAVWDCETTLAIEKPDAPAWSITVAQADFSGNKAGKSVRAYTVQSLMDIASAEEILILKVDVEGAEQALFRVSPAWSEKVVALMIELHDWMFPGERRSAGVICQLAKLDIEVVSRATILFVFQNLAGLPAAAKRKAFERDDGKAETLASSA